MADQDRNDSSQNRGQKPDSPQYSDEPQQTQDDERQRMQDEEPTSTSGAERGRGPMADDRGRTGRQHDPRDHDTATESDLDDHDDQMDDESEDDGPVR